MDPKEDNKRPDSEEKMLIKTIKEMQEENKSKAEADNGKAEAGTDTWHPGGQKPEGPKTRRHREVSWGTRDKGQPVYTTQDVTLKKNSLNFIKCDEFAEDMMIERTTAGLTEL